VDITLAVSQGLKDGTPLKQIRAQIDAKYQAMGYTPTPTPPIP